MAKFIPTEHFKGVQSLESKCPLAFITPMGTDKAALNRIETVKSWAVNYRKSDDKHFEVIKNEPMQGFKIGEEVRRWSTSNVVWRIEDPRGFQLEISSGNMAYLIAETNIKKGVFDEELVWVRDRSDNYLLPVDSEEHKEYLQNLVGMNTKIGIRDLTIGDHIHDANGMDGIFLGGFYGLEFESLCYDNNNKFLKVKRKYFVDITSTEDEEKGITSFSNFKGLSIIKKGARENKDYTDVINASKSSYGFISVQKKKFDALAISQSARYEEVKSRKNPSEYLAQIEDGGVYQVQKGRYNGSRDYFYRIIINNQANTYSKDRISEYGDSYHSMSTFGISNSISKSASIKKLIKQSSIIVKLVITINGADYTVME